MRSPAAPCSLTCSRREAAGATRIAVVVGPDRDEVAGEAARHAADAEIFVQAERLGTGHAVLSAREALARER